MKASDDLRIAETTAWLVSHRANSALPGYLIVSAKTAAANLFELERAALIELGPLLARAQNALETDLDAKRVYIGRYGHSPGQPIHFHVIPIYGWVEELFWRDERYRLLQTFAEGPGETPTDGAELTLFVWREFCERATPPPISGQTVSRAVEILRASMSSEG